MKVVAWKYLPTRLPVQFTVVVWLLVDRFRSQFSPFNQGAIWATMALIWIGSMIALWNEEHVAPTQVEPRRIS